MDIRSSRMPLVLITAAGLGLAACAVEHAYGDLARPTTTEHAQPLPWDTAMPAGDQGGGTEDPSDDDPGTSSPSPTSSPTGDPTEEPEPTSSRTPSDPTSPSPTETSEPPDPDESDPPSEPDGIAGMESRVVELTNVERQEHGCEPLRTDERLRTAARAHSGDMAQQNYLDHVNPQGEGPGERAAAAGYTRWGGENVAMGYPTAEAAVAAWMNSEGHRANILNCDFLAVGAGAAESSRGMYWTQKFGYE